MSLKKNPTINIEVRQPEPVMPEPIAALVCPSCGYEDIREIEQGTRANRATEVNPDTQTITFMIDDWGDFEHHSFLCVNCGTEVSLPENWDVAYS